MALPDSAGRQDLEWSKKVGGRIDFASLPGAGATSLPNLNGFDILAYLRNHAESTAVPAIMATAQVSDADVLRGLTGDADGSNFKPFEGGFLWIAFGRCWAW